MTIFKLTRVVIVSLTLAALSACNLGNSSSSGPSGPSGTNGTNGTNGVSGTSGLTALVAVAAEPPGLNCTNGGNRITSGLDTSGNGALDPSEVTNTQYVCNGAPGSAGTAGAAGANGETTLVATSTVAAGANCPNGGKQINIGLDTNRNGVLDPSEVTSSSYVCNGANGTNGTNGANGENSLVTVVPEAAGANCASGGSLVSSGLDTNGDGILDPREVTNRQYICNGAPGAAGSNGLKSLVSLVALAAGNATCANGGTQVNSGVDTNGNGVLDPSEITNTQDVCNGAAGATGAAGSNGQNSLVSLTTLTVGNASCPNGGTEAQSGIDTNGDGILQGSEVTNTAYACNGAPGATGATGATGSNGANSLIAETPEPAGVNCTYAGVKVTSGIDVNGDGILEAGEVQATSYVCNGPPGPGITWIDVTGTSVQAASNQGYLADNAAKVTITLPTAPVLGAIVSVTGVGTGGWVIGQNAGQYVRTTALPGSPPATDHWMLTSAPNNSWSAVASSADGAHLVAAIHGGGIYISADSGNTWTPTSAPGNLWTSVASSADGSHLVAVAQNRGIYTSADSGNTWTLSSAPGNLYWYSVASSADGSHLVAAIYGGAIYTSADSGNTWTLSSAPGNLFWHSVASSADGSHLVAVIYTGGIYTSADSGNTWTQTSAPNNGWSAVASSADGSRLVAVVIAGGGIYTSGDSGTNWTQTSAPNSSWYSVASSADGRLLVAVAPNGGIYTSVYWGMDWTQTSAANNNWVFVASSADGSHRVAVNSNGAGIYTSDFGQQTTLGTAGSISGSQDDAIELQYVGNGVFIVLDDTSNSGAFTVH
jgi:photosystem II stability/assembly factor-like uncharacterized protein